MAQIVGIDFQFGAECIETEQIRNGRLPCDVVERSQRFVVPLRRRHLRIGNPAPAVGDHLRRARRITEIARNPYAVAGCRFIEQIEFFRNRMVQGPFLLIGKDDGRNGVPIFRMPAIAMHLVEEAVRSEVVEIEFSVFHPHGHVERSVAESVVPGCGGETDAAHITPVREPAQTDMQLGASGCGVLRAGRGSTDLDGSDVFGRQRIQLGERRPTSVDTDGRNVPSVDLILAVFASHPRQQGQHFAQEAVFGQRVAGKRHGVTSGLLPDEPGHDDDFADTDRRIGRLVRADIAGNAIRRFAIGMLTLRTVLTVGGAVPGDQEAQDEAESGTFRHLIGF